MVSVKEATGAKTELASDLAQGLETLSLNQTINFNLYVRMVLPIDGYVFWVNAKIVSTPTIVNSNLISGEALEEVDGEESLCISVDGSLHFSTDVRQEEPENYAANRVVFTSKEEISLFNEIAPNMMWIGEFEGMRFGFSSQSSRYKQAGLWHYAGFALFADMDTQIIDTVQQFDTSQVVSNSLPAWLAMNAYKPPYGFGNPGFQIYPSFLAPMNLVPPYAVVQIYDTRGLASAPTIDPFTSTHTQLCTERVRVTLWGTRNLSAMNFVDMVYQFSSDVPGAFGIQNIPVPHDEKRTQVELLTIAEKKVVDFEVSYLQQAMRNIALQFIKKAIPTFIVGKP